MESSQGTKEVAELGAQEGSMSGRSINTTRGVLAREILRLDGLWGYDAEEARSMPLPTFDIRIIGPKPCVINCSRGSTWLCSTAYCSSDRVRCMLD